jgi:sugar O-acyltransferase (sialic acid O-acetyltransferase NeuD family)
MIKSNYDKKIIFYGGTGQCKVMRELADKFGKLVAVLDDTENMVPPFDDINFYCGKDCYRQWEKTKTEEQYYFVITIGNPNGQVRREKAHFLIKKGLKPLSLIHDSAIIGSNVTLGEGLQIHAGVVISPFAKIGNFCILNTRSLIDHDCLLKDGVETGPGSVLCGEINVGENTWIGANSVIKHKLSIGKNVVVGAGAAVVKNIDDGSIVVGVPASPIKKKKNETK